jgi:hypothetical protein
VQMNVVKTSNLHPLIILLKTFVPGLLIGKYEKGAQFVVFFKCKFILVHYNINLL